MGKLYSGCLVAKSCSTLLQLQGLQPTSGGSMMVKNEPANAGDKFNPWVKKIPWRRKWQPTPIFLPGISHGQRSLAGYSPQGCKKLDTTQQLNKNKNKPYRSSFVCYLLLFPCCFQYSFFNFSHFDYNVSWCVFLSVNPGWDSEFPVFS